MKTVTLRAPDDSGASVSWRGKSFAVVDGSVEVPAEAVDDLLSHRFRFVDDQALAAHAKAKADADELDLAIMTALKFIISGVYSIEQCVDWICAYLPAGDRKTVTARITEGVDRLKAKIDAPADAVEFPPHLIDFGWPVRVDHPGRGPKPRRTQYDATLDQRKAFYHRLVRAPAALAAGRLRIRNRDRKILATRIENILTNKGKVPPSTPKHKLVSTVQYWLSRQPQYKRRHDDTTVRAVLQELGYLPSPPGNRPR